MCAMSIILVAFASVKVAFYSVTLALFSRASGLIWTKYTFGYVSLFRKLTDEQIVHFVCLRIYVGKICRDLTRGEQIKID